LGRGRDALRPCGRGFSCPRPPNRTCTFPRIRLSTCVVRSGLGVLRPCRRMLRRCGWFGGSVLLPGPLRRGCRGCRSGLRGSVSVWPSFYQLVAHKLRATTPQHRPTRTPPIRTTTTRHHPHHHHQTHQLEKPLEPHQLAPTRECSNACASFEMFPDEARRLTGSSRSVGQGRSQVVVRRCGSDEAPIVDTGSRFQVGSSGRAVFPTSTFRPVPGACHGRQDRSWSHIMVTWC